MAKKKANGKARKRASRIKYTTGTIAPPAEVITPAVARKWLHRTYPALACLTSLISYPFAVRGLGSRKENELAVDGMRSIALDNRIITTACGAVLGTGRPITMRYDSKRLGNHGLVARKLRALLRFEERHPQPGTRGILERAMWQHESWKVGDQIADDFDKWYVASAPARRAEAAQRRKRVNG